MNHLSLCSSSVERSIAFYTEFLGFQVTSARPDRAFLRDKNNFLLALSHADVIPAFPSWFHLGLMVDGPVQVQALHERMQSAGVSIPHPLNEEAGEFSVFYCLDPDGYKIEIAWHNEKV